MGRQLGEERERKIRTMKDDGGHVVRSGRVPLDEREGAGRRCQEDAESDCFEDGRHYLSNELGR